MRELVAVPAGDIGGLTRALRSALDGSGPAVLPVDPAGAAGAAGPHTSGLGLEQVPLPVALVIATSGSSGAPKRVLLSAGALLASAAATESALGGPGEWVLALPGHYIAGVQVIVRAIAAGSDPHPVAPGPFTAGDFARAVQALPDTRRRYSSLVPTQLHRVVGEIENGDRAVGAAIRSLDALLIGGGRLDAGLADRADRVGVRVVRTYGASETAGGCVYDGVPLAGVQVRVRDGEVQLAGPVLADGYLGDDARTAAFLPEPGRTWYRTGDSGTWDGQRLTVTGRLDDVIVSGGEKVSLALIESAVRAQPGLAEAVVVAVPDAEWGQVPVVAATRAADLPALRAAVAERLGRAAAPARVLVLDPLPALSSGKPDRRRIESLAIAAAHRSVTPGAVGDPS